MENHQKIHDVVLNGKILKMTETAEARRNPHSLLVGDLNMMEKVLSICKIELQCVIEM